MSPVSNAKIAAQRYKCAPLLSELTGFTYCFTDLQSLVCKYSQWEWLNFLSRLQYFAAAGGQQDSEDIQQALRQTMPRTVRQKLEEYYLRVPREAIPLFPIDPWTITVCEQLSFLYCNNEPAAPLFSEAGLTDAWHALFLAHELLQAGDAPQDEDSLLRALAFLELRSKSEPGILLAARSFMMFRINRGSRTKALLKYRRICAAAGIPLVKHVIGGLATYVPEATRPLADIQTGWPTVGSRHNVSKKLSTCISSYLHRQALTCEELRNAAMRVDGDRSITSWTLEGLQQHPLLRHNSSTLCLNLRKLSMLLRHSSSEFTGPPSGSRQSAG